jgi:dTDP-4-amino-4,6-dideoxygalactose transaminase
MDYKIPLFELNFDEQEETAVIDTLRSRWISTGPKTAELEKNFAQALNAGHALALTNCTVALHLAMRLLDIGPDDEVIVPSLTFVATVNAVKYVGATPVFCDITSLNDLTMDPQKAEQLISKKTKAIVVMHYGGFPCNMTAFLELARKYNIRLIEDACHGPLSEYEGKKLGTLGDIGCFSFFSNKNISTGEGGMLVTNSQDIYNRAKLLRSHGMTTLSYERAKGHSTSYDVVDLGYNYRMDDIRSSIGIVQLAKLPENLNLRSEVRKKYVAALSKVSGIVIPFKDHTDFVSNYIFPIILENSDADRREEVRSRLHEKGIQTSVHYPAVHRFSIYSAERTELPISEYVADALITLPMFGTLRDEQIAYIAACLTEIVCNA